MSNPTRKRQRPLSRITVRTLKRLGACESQIARFKNFLGKRKSVPCTVENAKLAQEYGLCVEWCAQHGLLSREICLSHPEWAYLHALWVAQKPEDDTRAAACGIPYVACDYARYVDKGPHPDTRKAACRDPWASLNYAVEVDCRPMASTRKAACERHRAALSYAHSVDRCPSDDTRTAACKSAETAFDYMRTVDQKPTLETVRALLENPRLLARCRDFFGDAVTDIVDQIRTGSGPMDSPTKPKKRRK